ncbi:Outer envelope protein 61 [Linum perenne]
MFNGMMDPELIKLAQEQMSRMSPDELAKIQQQMMSNPDLMKMASESMKNMRPDDLKQAAEQLKYTRPDEMAEIGEKMANASPEEIAAMRSRIDSQVTYEMNAAEMLKKQGNLLHSEGKYSEALQKYLHAKKNLKGILSSKGKTLLLACSLNLMSCYLKTKQYDECVQEGTEVLNYEGKNLKALYRRGQAYKELGQLQDAVSDLAKAHEMSPEDDTIAAVLRDAEERLAEEGSCHVPKGVVIEEITEDVSSGDVSSGNHGSPSQESMNVSNTNVGGSMTSSESLHALKDDPEAVRTFQNFISNTDAETLAALNGGKAGDISPDMFKTATNMIGRMSPDELQKMLQMASSFQRGNPFSNGVDSIGPGSVPPNMSPDMIKAASEMMGNMPPEELQKMFKMASSLRGENAAATGGFSDKNVSGSGQTSKSAEPREHISVHGSISGDPSSSSSLFSRSMSADQSGFPSPGGDLQEQLRNQMNDPATRQMFASMMKNMSPETVANMSKQFGVQLSPEDAAKAQQAMSSLSPEDLDKMMRWMDRLQKGAAGAKKAKNWLLGKPGLIMAICMLLLAMLLHWLGFIGR